MALSKVQNLSSFVLNYKTNKMKNKFLAKQVKELRKRKGLSQEELAENSGVRLRTIQRIEKGETEPTGETLKRMSHALNVIPEELIDWTVIEDRGYLKAMNLSALTFILFPLLGILIPLIMWVAKKDKLKDINKVGKTIINFQITWTIILFAGVIINALVLTNRIHSTGDISAHYFISSQNFNLIFLSILYILNLVLIIFNTYRIQKIKNVFYQPKINFV
jgi:transcriptional regulator with XRE-family HTH domain